MEQYNRSDYQFIAMTIYTKEIVFTDIAEDEPELREKVIKYHHSFGDCQIKVKVIL